MHLHGHLHLPNSVILLFFLDFTEFNLSSEHGWKKLCILSDLFKFVRDLLLELFSFFNFRKILVLQSFFFLFDSSQVMLQRCVVSFLTFLIFKVFFFTLLKHFDLNRELFDLSLLIKLIFGIVLFIVDFAFD